MILTKRMIDISNNRFGRLVAVNPVRKSIHGNVWNCLCDCGNYKEVLYRFLASGSIRSCGCFYRDRLDEGMRFRHGLSKSLSYSSWYSMKERCLNLKARNYNHYGGRGITICDRWMHFENFYEDMGDRPGIKGEYELDRKNPNGNYEPNNCRWILKGTGAKRKRVRL